MFTAEGFAGSKEMRTLWLFAQPSKQQNANAKYWFHLELNVFLC